MKEIMVKNIEEEYFINLDGVWVKKIRVSEIIYD